ncbi:type II secretion system F family protein [Candidatus Woesearchaeota archaeon]|nr:type II secretion system F family protein [Candidatus Woesearchaeota archaeon]
METSSFGLDKKIKSQYLNEIGADKYILQRAVKRKKEDLSRNIPYTIYRKTSYGSAANYLFENLTFILTTKYKDFFNNLTHLIRLADIRVLSKTYVSMMILTSMLAGFFGFFSYLSFMIIRTNNAALGVISSVPVAFLASLTTFGFFYLYPYLLVSSRKKAIKNDLPFLIIHMAAIAGSGASPSSVFNLILRSGEYKGIEGEIKKIVNYTNLFGYDLSTALRTVAATTPSYPFRELLNGIIATTESGSDLKSYLNEKAKDALNTYTLERRRYVESLATYSDIYTGAFIAAPLLFITTLAIINVIGGTIGNLSVKTISIFGIFVALPLLNIAFLIFLSFIQPEE